MTPFQYSRRTEQQYAADILGAVSRYFSSAYDWTYAALMSIPEWFEAYARQAAERMITHSYVTNARSWREAARISGRGPELYSALEQELRGPVGRRYRALIAENANLIKSLPQKIAAEVVAKVAAAGRAGERAEAFSAEGMLKHVSRSHARLIARTETAKANSALTQARAEDLGINWYWWETSKDERVRPSHRKMQGVLIRYDDPPSPEALIHIHSTLGHYHAGNAPNDRCFQAPLMNYRQISWPHKVYRNNSIRTMTLAAFRELNHAAKAA